MTDTAIHSSSNRGFKRLALTAATTLLAGCAIGPHPATGIAKVNPASIAAAPATWDGREVEIVGLVVWESGDLGLYQDYGSYCRAAQQAAIHVRWPDWPGVTQKDSRRRVIVRGVFRNRAGMTQADGSTGASAGAPGPGPLEPGMVVKWLSAPRPACPNRQ